MARIKSREKGKAGERELAAVLRRRKTVSARRGVQYSGSPDGESPDVVHNIPGLHIECKRVERLNIASAMAQARADCGARVPVVAHRRNREEWLVTLPLESFLDLIGLEKEDDEDFSDL